MSQAQHAIGRFRFRAARLFQITGQSTSIYRVEVRHVPLPWGGGPRTFWEAEIRRLRAGYAIVGTVDLRAGQRGVWYLPDPESPDVHELLGVRFVDEFAVVAERSCAAAKHSIVETLVGNVLEAYVPSTVSGFCIGSAGAIVSDPGTNESASLTLSAGDISLRIETMTVAEPDHHTHSNLDAERGYMADRGGRLEVLREGPRVAAGLTGKEIGIVLEGEPPLVRYTWHYGGESISATRPRVDVVAIGPLARRGQLEEAWAVVLDSLSAVPPL